MFTSSGVLSWGLRYVAKSQETQVSMDYDGNLTRNFTCHPAFSPPTELQRRSVLYSGRARAVDAPHHITLKLHIDTLLLLDAPVVVLLLEAARRALAVVVRSGRGHRLGLLAELHAAINKIVELAALPPGDVDEE